MAAHSEPSPRRRRRPRFPSDVLELVESALTAAITGPSLEPSGGCEFWTDAERKAAEFVSRQWSLWLDTWIVTRLEKLREYGRGELSAAECARKWRT